MKKSNDISNLIGVAVLWIIFSIFVHYNLYLSVFAFLISIPLWFGASLTFLIITIYQFVKLIRERKKLEKIQIIKFLFYGLFSILTFFLPVLSLTVFNELEWHLLYRKRMEIVEQVRNKELNPNVRWNNIRCELPFDFPIVSKGGNDILIYRNDSTQTITVQFYVSLGFLDDPSTFYTYTDDENVIKHFDSTATKIKENWYETGSDEDGTYLWNLYFNEK